VPDAPGHVRERANPEDTDGRYLASVDPTTETAESIWGVPVLQSTGFTAGEAVLLDTTLVGRIAVRESLTLRIGYSGDDFTRNIVRTVAEERLNFAIERPAAVCHLTGLPTVAVAATSEETKTTAKK
jgi:HK97 family phage major capsid protein